MMKYKLLSVSHVTEINIGDYIQALASSQFLPSLDGFIDRESLKDLDIDEDCSVIMNGWFMHHPEQWPPSEKIHPLFVAFHINTLAKKDMLNTTGIGYLKEHEPIGCRDNNTVNLLNAHGVKAYFSGCMTLTLGYKFMSQERNGKCYFVDPFFYTDWSLKSICRNAYRYVKDFRAVNIIARKYPSSKSLLRKGMILTTFYREYSKFFSKEVLLNAEYVCQQSIQYSQLPTDSDRLKEAERLVRCYAKAEFVVTSRIHCGLPCLGLGTPVIFIEDAAQSEASSCRLEGLKELFNSMEWKGTELIPRFAWDGKISQKHYPKNKDSWKGIAARLIQQCTSFINEQEIIKESR